MQRAERTQKASNAAEDNSTTPVSWSLRLLRPARKPKQRAINAGAANMAMMVIFPASGRPLSGAKNASKETMNMKKQEIMYKMILAGPTLVVAGFVGMFKKYFFAAGRNTIIEKTTSMSVLGIMRPMFRGLMAKLNANITTCQMTYKKRTQPRRSNMPMPVIGPMAMPARDSAVETGKDKPLAAAACSIAWRRFSFPNVRKVEMSDRIPKTMSIQEITVMEAGRVDWWGTGCWLAGSMAQRLVFFVVVLWITRTNQGVMPAHGRVGCNCD